jgi:dolichol kinase
VYTVVALMTTNAMALTTSRELAIELLDLLRELDPARWRVDLEEAAQARLQKITEMLEELRATAISEFDGLSERCSELLGDLNKYAPDVDLKSAECREAWERFRVQLQPCYEALADTLRGFEIHIPSLRPTNYTRNAFHVASAVFSLCLVEFFIDRPSGLLLAALAFALSGWTMEISRRRWPAANRVIMRVFQPVAHPHETWRINSATWYTTALVALALTGEPIAQASAVVILGVGDPLAALVGRRYGRHKLINGRSREGSLTFLRSSGAAASAVLLTLHALSWQSAVAIAFGAALPATLAELLSRRVDDNLTIPLSAAAGALVVLGLL